MPAAMPASMPSTLKVVTMKVASTSESSSSPRSCGSAGGTLVMYAPATRPPQKTAQMPRQFVVTLR